MIIGKEIFNELQEKPALPAPGYISLFAYAGHLWFVEANGVEHQLPGPSTDKYYRHTQTTPSTQWNIQHNLNKIPSITVTDSAGTVVHGDYEYPDMNHAILTFEAGFSGYADLN